MSGAAETPTFWAAPEIVKAGYKVFPVNDKTPKTEGSFYAASDDMSEVAAWIEAGRGNDDIAIATGVFGKVVAIDADTDEAFAEMQAKHGEPAYTTRRGGHWLFKHPRNGKVVSNKISAGLDRKGDGGIAVVPPSKGRRWTNGIPSVDALPMLPKQYWSKTRGPTPGERKIPETRKDAAASLIAEHVRGIGPDAPGGGRHDHLRHLCGVLLSREVSFVDAEDILKAAWGKVGGDLSDRLGAEIPNTLVTTQAAMAEGRATGVPKMEEITPGLYAELEGIFGWKARMTVGGHGRNGHPKGNHDPGEASDAWEDPAPLPDGLPPVAPFDPALLPDALRPWCEDIAERMQVPLDYVAIGAVTVAASLIGRKVGIHPKRHDDWLVVPNLWAGIVGPPSAMKSPALAEITKPLDRLVAEAREAHEEALAEHDAEAEAVEAEKTALKKAVDAAAKKSVETGDRSTLDELIDRRRNMEVPEPPAERRYKTSDTTIEKLVEILRDNPFGVLVGRDELTGWLRSLDKQGREMDRAFYLESWNGTGSYTVDRIGRGTLHVQALCVSILGGIQPGPLRSYVYGATRGGEGADGLLQRFQLLVWPDPPKGSWRNVDRYPDADAKNRAYAVYGALDKMDPGEAGATNDDLVAEGGIPAVRFSPEAQDLFDAWRHELEAKLRDGGLSEVLVSHLAKYRSLMPSLALVFHLVDTAGGAVGLASVMRAGAWCEYLEGHAHRVYASGESPALEGARALLERIRKGDVKDGDKIREVYRGRHWSKLATAEKVNAAAGVLEDHGWLRVEKLDTGGRPAHYLRIHPALKKEA